MAQQYFLHIIDYVIEDSHVGIFKQMKLTPMHWLYLNKVPTIEPQQQTLLCAENMYLSRIK